MAGGIIDYGILTQNALRDVVREALAVAAALKRAPGEHHFYVHFRTHDEGVEIADWMREEYPDVMPIVLQHQFWDLAVDDDKFSVTLAFKGQKEPMTIPFAAVTAFMDPSVQFGLRFEDADGDAAPAEAAEDAAPEAEEPEAADTEDGRQDADVISLDKFRK